MLHFALNSTSMEGGQLITGGQMHRYLAPVWDALDAMGVDYGVGREPARGAVNVYSNTRSTYERGSHRMDRAAVGVSHGIGCKGYRFGYRFHRWVIVPGSAHAEVLRRGRFPERKVQVLGFPKLDPIWRGEVTGEGVWADDGRVRVLYAPTHGGGSERHRDGNPGKPGAKATSWWHRDEVMALLSEDDFEVVLAPHPRHSEGRQATFAEYVGADVVVADGGSTIFEGLVLGKPVVLPAWLTRERNEARDGGRNLEAQVYRRGIGVHVDDPAGMADAVRRAAEQGQPSRDRVFAEGVVDPGQRGLGGRLWAEFLAEVDAGEATAPPVPRRPRRAGAVTA